MFCFWYCNRRHIQITDKDKKKIMNMPFLLFNNTCDKPLNYFITLLSLSNKDEAAAINVLDSQFFTIVYSSNTMSTTSSLLAD
jgi:hypothetical protein